jgi:hypothetical protein
LFDEGHDRTIPEGGGRRWFSSGGKGTQQSITKATAKVRTGDNSKGDNKGGKGDGDRGYKDDGDNGGDGNDGGNGDDSGYNDVKRG